MTFLERPQAHKGDLIRLKTQLEWYDDRDQSVGPDIVCLLLDIGKAAGFVTARTFNSGATNAAHLLIDGSPHWVWIDEKDLEVINEAR